MNNLTSLCDVLFTGSVDKGFLNTLKETPGTYPFKLGHSLYTTETEIRSEKQTNSPTMTVIISMRYKGET